MNRWTIRLQFIAGLIAVLAGFFATTEIGVLRAILTLVFVLVNSVLAFAWDFSKYNKGKL